MNPKIRYIQIGHNVKIGDYTIIAGCTGIAGSTEIGRYCVIGGHVGMNGHIKIADNVIITGGAKVIRSINESGVYSSVMHAQPHRAWLRVFSNLLQIDKIIGRLKKLEDKINE